MLAVKTCYWDIEEKTYLILWTKPVPGQKTLRKMEILAAVTTASHEPEMSEVPLVSNSKDTLLIQGFNSKELTSIEEYLSSTTRIGAST